MSKASTAERLHPDQIRSRPQRRYLQGSMSKSPKRMSISAPGLGRPAKRRGQLTAATGRLSAPRSSRRIETS